MSRTALVVGGTGPTGVFIVDFMLAAGYEVTVFNSGRHDAGVLFAGPVERLYGDARDEESVRTAFATRNWDVAICAYGKLRLLARELGGKTRRLVGITGQPVYQGAARRTPDGGIQLPVPESAPRLYDETTHMGQVAGGEDELFRQHANGEFEAVVVRYPGVYGPRAPINHEWAIVKRVLDKRRLMLMPHDGLSYFQRGYAENVAWLVFLAATRPEAAGEAFNAGDQQVMSARRVAEVILDELAWKMDLVGIPAEFVDGVFPLAEKAPLILDMSKPRNLLGYSDRVAVEPATRATARWLREHPPAPGEITGAAGTFDYAEEDRVAALWADAVRPMPGRSRGTGGSHQ